MAIVTVFLPDHVIDDPPFAICAAADQIREDLGVIVPADPAPIYDPLTHSVDFFLDIAIHRPRLGPAFVAIAKTPIDWIIRALRALPWTNVIPNRDQVDAIRRVFFRRGAQT